MSRPNYDKCTKVYYDTINDYKVLSLESLVDAIELMGKPYPTDLMESELSNAQKQDGVLHLLADYKKAECVAKLQAIIRKNRKERKTRKSRKNRKSKKTRRN